MANHNETISTLHHLLDYDVSKFAHAGMQWIKSLPEWIAKTGLIKLKTVLQINVHAKTPIVLQR